MSVDEVISFFEEQGDQNDLLYSVDKNGEKNGAHFVMSKRYILSRTCVKKVKVVDDCTNVHNEKDLKNAAKRLKAQAGAIE